MFDLHPRLQQDCLALGRFELCRLLLMNERRYPWFILVPERAGISEIYQLPEVDQIRLLRESSVLARVLAETYSADKMNIATIGNLVPQLHVHHIVRYRNDPAWPSPVWGKDDPLRYDDAGLSNLVTKLTRISLPGFTWGLA